MNKFKKGDAVVLIKGKRQLLVMTVESVGKLYISLKLKSGAVMMFNILDIRHATTQEIQASKRL